MHRANVPISTGRKQGASSGIDHPTKGGSRAADATTHTTTRSTNRPTQKPTCS